MSALYSRYDDDINESGSDEDRYEGTRYYTRYKYGDKYPKDNAIVPDDLLMDYVHHMGYTNFSTDKIELEISRDTQRADYIEYDHHREPIVIYKLRGKDIIQSKIYEILKTASCDNIVKCKRPGYIYTARSRYGSFSYDDLEELKYSGCGQDYIKYDGCKFF
jgi:hypothetical protein